MTTALTLINRAFELIGYKDPDETLSAADAQAGLDALNSMLDGWNTQPNFIVSTAHVSASVSAASATVGAGMTFAVARPTRLEEGGYTRVNGVDYPLEVIDRAAYDAIPVKSVTSTFPQYVHYDATLPTAAVYFYPVPSSAVTVYLPFAVALTQFASTATDVTLAPGYRKAIEYSLAEELAPGRRELSKVIARAAFTARKAIRRTNVEVPTLDVMPGNVRFNVYTGL